MYVFEVDHRWNNGTRLAEMSTAPLVVLQQCTQLAIRVVEIYESGDAIIKLQLTRLLSSR